MEFLISGTRTQCCMLTQPSRRLLLLAVFAYQYLVLLMDSVDIKRLVYDWIRVI
jgi:hypothetical protein